MIPVGRIKLQRKMFATRYSKRKTKYSGKMSDIYGYYCKAILGNESIVTKYKG